MDTKRALIVGAGPGLSASLARKLSTNGTSVALVARNVGKLETLVRETGAKTFSADVSDPAAVAGLFEAVDKDFGEPDLVVYNASGRTRGPIAELDPDAVRAAIAVSAFGGFLVAQQAARRMVPRGRGAMLFTGATASLKAYAQSAAFAMGKFALRALAQSAAREYGPKGIHVAHFIIDGAIRSDRNPGSSDKPDGLLDPDAIADAYLAVLNQPRSAWSFEVDLRPWVETF